MTGAAIKPVVRIERVGELTFRVLSSVREGSDAPVWVLVHGVGVSHCYLARLHRLLGATVTVLSVDMPGFGGLPTPAGTVTVPEMSAALGRLLDRNGVSEAVLVGHSMGAQWTVELAAQRPELASRVVVIGPVADERHRSVTVKGLALAIDSLGEPPSGNWLVFTDYAFRCTTAWYLDQSRHMVSYPIEDRIPDLQAPLLVLRESAEPIAGLGWCRRLCAQAGSSGSLAIVPGHRHLVQHTAPRAVASARQAFVQAGAV